MHAHEQDSAVSVDLDALQDRVLRCLEDGDDAGLRGALGGLHPTDIANLLEQIAVDDLCAAIFRAAPDEISGEVLASLPEGLSNILLGELSEREIAGVVRETAPDDAVDIIEELAPEQREEVLREVPPEQRAEIERLIGYDPKSAGGLMTPRFTSVRAGMTAAQAVEQIRRIADTETETIYYVYVTDDDGILVGVLSLRELMLKRSTEVVRDFMRTPVRSVNADEHQQNVAHLIREYDLLALPVVDSYHRMIGVITVDDILDVLEEEESEDVQKMFGAGGDERVDSPVWLSVRRRLPWLTLNLGTATLAALVVDMLSDAITRVPLAVAFMPLIAGVAGNTGAQSLAVVFRGVILDEGGSWLESRIILKSLLLGLLNGVPIGLVGGVLVFVFSLFGARPDIPVVQLAGVVMLAMVAAMMVGSVVGAGIPLLMRRLGWDPAQNASIFLTATTDITGFAIYLSLLTGLV
jgi:magnesium transporter